MKRESALLSCLMLASAQVSAQAQMGPEPFFYPILECVQPRLLGAPVYTVSKSDFDGAFPAYRLTRSYPFIDGEPVSADLYRARLIQYGGTFILTEDQGRSGYAHIYAHPGVSIIDIQLFQHPGVSTAGPVMGYMCSQVY